MVEFFLALFLMLAGAWILGEIFKRIGQPPLVGQLLAGAIIGPSVLNVVQVTADISSLESVAVFFIMLLTGLAVKPAKIIAAGRRGAVVSTIAFLIPFVAGVEVARLFGAGEVSSLTVGLTISITAVPVNTIVLMELGILDTDLGATVIAAGVIDDIISFVALSLIEQFGGGGSAAADAAVEWGLVKVAIFLVVLFVGEHLLRGNVSRVRSWTSKNIPALQAEGSYIILMIILAIGVSLLAEWSGMQFVIGAFFAGFLMSEVAGGAALEKATSVIRGGTFGFFAPFAFAYIGTELVLSSLGSILPLVGAILAAAIVSKFLGGYIGAKITRFSPEESLAIGFLMNSRGFVELVIASTAYGLALIDQALFSMVVGVGIVTTIISPIATRVVIRRLKLRTAARE